MSLIDEALKRAQAAHQGEMRPGSGQRPWTPVPLPDRREARRRTTLRAAGVVLLAGAILAAAWLLRPAAKTPGESRNAARPTAAPVLPTPLAEAIVAPPYRPAPAAEQRAGASLRPTPSAAGAASAGAPPNVSPPSPAALANGRTYVGSITLPGGARIELGGIVYSETNATALVNGRPVGAGAFVEGFTIVKIEPGRLELEGNGITFFLALNKSAP